jgi:general secretion pathway protein D
LSMVLAIMAICAQAPAEPNQPFKVAVNLPPEGQITSNSVIALRNLDADKARDFLSRLKIGKTISRIPRNNALVISATPQQLVMARTVLHVIDSNKPYVTREFKLDSGKMPPLSVVTERLGNVSVGSLMDSPSSKGQAAIADIINGTPTIIAPASEADRVIQAVQDSQGAAPSATAPKRIESLKSAAGPNVPPQPAATPSPAPAVAAPKTQTPPSAEANEAEPNDMLNKVVSDLLAQEKAKEAKAKEEEVKAKEEQAKAELLKKQAEDAATAAKAAEAAKSQAQPAEQAEPNETVIAEANEISLVPPQPQPDPNAFRPTDIPNGDQIVSLDSLPETMPINALLDLVGRQLNVNYLYDPAKVQGQVTIKIRNQIKVKDLYSLTESVMKFAGFAMSRKDNLVTVVPITEAVNIDPTLKTDGGKIRAGDIVVTSVFHLNYIPADRAQNLLANMKLGVTPQNTTNMIAIPETNSLIVTEYAYRMDRIEKLLKIVDQPGAPREFRFRQLKYTLASALVPKIQGLAQQLGPETLRVETGNTTPQTGSFRGRNRPMPTPATQPGAAAGPSATKAGVYLDFDERTNRVLMVGAVDDIKLIEQLLDTFDVPQQDLRTVQEYQIQNVDAKQVVDTLNTLGIISGYEGGGGGGGGGGMGRTYRSQPAAQPGQPATGAGGQGTENPNEQPQVAILETTNSLLINATPEQHAAIQAIIAHVDREATEVAVPFYVYPLEYQDPDELQKVLTSIIEKTIKDKEGKVTGTVRREDDVAIVADKKSHALVVYASKKNQEWVGGLIKQLDRKRPQVLIETTLVEIDRDDAFNYDLSLLASNPGFSSKVGVPSSLTPIQTNTTNSVVSAGTTSGSGTAFFSDNHIQVLLTAMEKKNYGRVLAKPKVLVNDNEKGSIKTLDTRYIANTTTLLAGTGTGTQSTQFQPYDAKLELEITPHISEGDLLLLEVKLTREDFGATGPAVNGVTPPPNKTSSDVDTIVTVPDGSTIILGGLIKINQTKFHNKIPILGDIPVVGILFRNIDNTDTESKLYVFVKAYVLRPQEGQLRLPQLEQISTENRQAFEHAEERFQGHQDVPGIKPAPLTPQKVLEEQ